MKHYKLTETTFEAPWKLAKSLQHPEGIYTWVNYWTLSNNNGTLVFCLGHAHGPHVLFPTSVHIHMCTHLHRSTHADWSMPILGRLCHSWLVHLMWRGVPCPRPGTLLVEVILSVELSWWGGPTVLLIWGCDKHISVWDYAHVPHAVDTWESSDRFCSLTLKQCTEKCKGPSGKWKLWQSWKWHELWLCSFPHTDPLTEDRTLIGLRWLRTTSVQFLTDHKATVTQNSPLGNQA